MKETIKRAIEQDRPVSIISKNGNEYFGWVFARHTDDKGVFISPGFQVPYEDIARITLA